MARCKATLSIPVDVNMKTKQASSHVELACDLDADHDKVLSFHYDALREVEWRHPLKPAGVISTRTTPPKRAAASAAAHTSQFEIVTS